MEGQTAHRAVGPLCKLGTDNLAQLPGALLRAQVVAAQSYDDQLDMFVSLSWRAVVA